MAQRKFGVAMHGKMIDGNKILEDENYLDTEFKDTLLNLVSSCTTSKKQISKIKYPENPNYLPRSVRSTKDYDPINNPLFLRTDFSQDVLLFLEQHNRIELLSGAGLGKTTELQRIAWHFSKSDSHFYPFLIFLDKYVHQAISELLPSYWTEIPENKLIIILH